MRYQGKAYGGDFIYHRRSEEQRNVALFVRIGVSPLNGNERENRELTLPVYEFIRFLQTFAENEEHTEMWKYCDFVGKF